jgi:uncharacterized membrane protein
MVHDRRLEKMVAVGSFFSAVVLSAVSLIITPEHDIAGGTLMMCAQFLTLTATIFGIDYKWGGTRNGKQE